MKIGILVGSLRKESYTKKLVKAIISHLPEDWDMEFLQIGDLPLYNEEFDEGNPPEEYVRFRNEAKACDAYIFATPEYNRSVPAVIKNAFDVGSRPQGDIVWVKKPAAIFSASPGQIGGFAANQHLRQSMSMFPLALMKLPEVYVSRVADIMDEEGNITNDDTREFLQSIAESFEKHVNTFYEKKDC